MPNTPARLGKGMTVWYATPETTEAQRAQAAALLGALGAQIEVDDEKIVAMATAVSGTGPTYVFLVMEALIDAAVHLGFPRHIAHDLVIETLEGSTLFAKQSGMHPAELRNMVTSPGGTSAAALHELESGRLRTVLSEAVWAAYRRTVELGDQLEASRRRRAEAGHGTRRRADEPGRHRARHRPATRRRWPTSAASTCARPSATSGPTRSALWDRLVATWAGLDDAAWHLPGRRAVRCRRAGLVARRARRPLAAWQELADRLHADRDRDRPLAVRRRLRRRRLRPVQRAAPRAVGDRMSRDAIVARLAGDRARGAPRQAAALTAVGDPRRRRVGLGLPRRCTATTSTTSPSSSRGPRRCVPARSTATRSSPTRGPPTSPPSWPGTRPSPHDLDAPAARRPARPLGDVEVTPGWTMRDHVAHLADWAEEGARAIEVYRRDGDWLADPDEGIDAWNERHGRALARPSRPAATLARYERGARGDARRRRDARRSTELRSPDGWSWAYDCLHGHVRKHLAMLGPWCADGGLAGPDGLMPETDRATATTGLTIEAIVAVDPPREFRLHPRDRVVAYTAEAAGARQLFTLSLRGGAPDPAHGVGEGGRRPAVVARRPTAGVRPRRRALGRRGRRLADARASSPSRAARRPARWSPDGQRLAFLSRRRGWSQVWLIDAPVPRRGRPANEPEAAGADRR